mmetsp:Transcript_36265/g.112953  ORF Transcript_36265/g.112953 Transcript_36265/m.112953 type:complete len:387 (+) Transcript_36265:529-1689(+)
MAALAAQSLASLPVSGGAGPQELANTSWACAQLRSAHVPLLDAIAAESMRTIGGWCTAAASARPWDLVFSLAEALQTTGRLGAPLLEAAAGALRRHGEDLDAAAAHRGALGGPAPLPRATGRGARGSPCALVVQSRLCVLWKPAGWSVTVADEDEEDGSGVAERSAPDGGRELQEWLAREVGAVCPITSDARVSRGFIHRLDRDTSGSLLWASCYSGFLSARLQLRARNVRKEYLCLVWGQVPRGRALLESPLLRLEKMPGFPRSVASERGRPACTEVRSAEHLLAPDCSPVSLVRVRLHTGRLHQIRSHLSNEGHPLVGDEFYGGPPPTWCAHLFLHASRIAADIGDGPIDVDVPLPPALASALGRSCPAEAGARASKRRGRRAR